MSPLGGRAAVPRVSGVPARLPARAPAATLPHLAPAAAPHEPHPRPSALFPAPLQPFYPAGLPAAFQETVQTDCRGAALVHLVALVDAATQLGEGGEAAGAPADARGSEAPAAALARALQSALGSSYLRKLQELADNDSGSGGSGGRAEGLLAVLSPGLGTATELQLFLGAGADVAAAAAAPAGPQQEAALQRLLAGAVPAAVWQRCAAASLRVCWVAADACDGASADTLPVLPVLQAALQQNCARAAVAPLPELAGECGLAQFAARLGLPAPAPAAVEQGQGAEDASCWPGPAEGQEDALEGLKLLIASLEAHKGAGAVGVGQTVAGGQRKRAQDVGGHGAPSMRCVHWPVPAAQHGPPAADATFHPWTPPSL